MASTVLSTTLAIWAAFLSTSLAAIKLWEVWKQRLHITTSYAFGTLEYGNEVVIENPTGTPVIVTYWELLMIQKAGWHKTIVNGRFPNEGYCNLTIGPHSRHTMPFKGKEHFAWPSAGATHLYLKLHVVGRRRPVTLLVHRRGQR
jgi:hypothetical protein